MNKVLILAYYFPPIVASGSHRPTGFCAHLPSLGYKPVVLSTEPSQIHPPVAVDSSLERLLSPETEVHRLQDLNLQKSLLATRERLRKKAKNGTNSQNPSLATQDSAETPTLLGGLKSAVLDRVFRFPDQQRGWGNAAVKFACKIPASERPNVVFATGNPWSALVAGEKISRYLDIPFVADFRDPWSDNPKPPLSASLGRKAEALEAKIIRRATAVIANTEELAESFRRKFPESGSKVSTITNGFHNSLLDTFAGLPARIPAENNDYFELSYFGAVYELRRPTELLRAIKSLRDEGVAKADRLRVRFTGGWIVTDPECNALAAELEQQGAMVRERGLPHAEYLERLKQSQYLLVLQQGFPLQIPAKIYEYMASERPLLMIGGEGATANLINRTGLGRVCPNNVTQIKSTLISLLEASDKPAVQDKSVIEQFAYSELTKSVASCMDKAISDYSNLKGAKR